MERKRSSILLNKFQIKNMFFKENFAMSSVENFEDILNKHEKLDLNLSPEDLNTRKFKIEYKRFMESIGISHAPAKSKNKVICSFKNRSFSISSFPGYGQCHRKELYELLPQENKG
jgi:hypothetical protein